MTKHFAVLKHTKSVKSQAPHTEPKDLSMLFKGERSSGVWVVGFTAFLPASDTFHITH